MKIENLSPRFLETLPFPDKDAKNTSVKNYPAFAEELQRAQTQHLQQRLQSLLDEITVQGKKLSYCPTYQELKAYRELVRKFIGEAVEKMYLVQSQVGWDRRGRQKMYTLIQQIDTALAELTEIIRTDQKNQLGILARLDAIRGMLIDLYT